MTEDVRQIAGHRIKRTATQRDRLNAHGFDEAPKQEGPQNLTEESPREEAEPDSTINSTQT